MDIFNALENCINLVDDKVIDGNLVDGNLVDGNLVDGNLVDGNLVDGNLVDGKVIKNINYTPESSDNNLIIITKSGAFINFDDINTEKNTKKNAELDQSNAELRIIKIVKKIENYFTLKLLLITGQIRLVKICKVDRKKKRIIIPRFGIFEILNKKYGLDNYTTFSELKPGNNIECKFNTDIKLTSNQKIIIDHMLKNIYTKKRMELGSAGCVLNLAAGQGKSYLAAYLISIFNKKTIIILHSTSLIEQWIKVLNNCYNGLNIGQYYCKKKVLGDVMIMVINSALSKVFKFGSQKKGTYKEIPALEFYNMYGFIIYDECHIYANNYDGKIFNIAQTPYMLGLSATPDEKLNNFDNIHTWGIGPVLVANTLNGFEETVNDFKATVYKINYSGEPEYTKHIINNITGLTSVTSTISMIINDESRNRLIIKCILECLNKNLYTYVFADRRNILEQLKELLKEITNIDGEIVTDDDDFIRLVGGSKKEDIEMAEIKSKVIFTTYQYGATGRSIIKMNAIVLATPRKSKMKQTIGRILRLGSDTSIERQIYDIVDNKLNLKNQWSARVKYYKSMGFSIKEKKYKYDWEINSPLKNNIKVDNKDINNMNNIECKTKNIDDIRKTKNIDDTCKTKNIDSMINEIKENKIYQTDENKIYKKENKIYKINKNKIDENKLIFDIFNKLK